jgi:iron complex transport system permease protein
MAVAGVSGALGAVLLLLLLAGQASSIVAFLLAGVVLQTLAAAGVALALSLAPNPWAEAEIIDWLMGSLADRSVDDLKIAAPFVLAGCVLLALTGRALDALTLGETGARSLGVDLAATRWRLAFGVALATGASVAVTGVIGFVGLIVPHLLRPIFGARPGGLLLPSAIGGAALVLAADIGVRVAPGAAEIRLGVAMASLGAPFFLWLLLSLRRRIA